MRLRSMPGDDLDRMVRTDSAAGGDMEGVGCDDRRVLALEFSCESQRGGCLIYRNLGHRHHATLAAVGPPSSIALGSAQPGSDARLWHILVDCPLYLRAYSNHSENRVERRNETPLERLSRPHTCRRPKHDNLRVSILPSIFPCFSPRAYNHVVFRYQVLRVISLSVASGVVSRVLSSA